MSCSNCNNSGCGGCGGCGSVNASQVILNPVSAGTRSCSPLSNTCGGQPANPQPFYECAPQCAENHCQEIVNNYFSASVCTSYAFNMPDCGDVASVYFLGVKSLPVGSYLWDDLAGYLEVTAFNNQTGLATLLNNCNEGNAAAGTNIPACTCFTVQAPPCCDDSPDPSTPFLAADFTAPADSSCVTITVTSVAGLAIGDIISLGAGLYLLNDILSPTVIEICNTGEGITPGTLVEARNESGQLQYPIVSTSNCCDQMQGNIDGDSSSASDPLTSGNFLDTPAATVVLNNSSTSKTLLVMASQYAKTTLQVPAAGSLEPVLALRQSQNAGPYATLSSLTVSFDVAALTGPYDLVGTYSTVHSVAPGASLTLDFVARVTNNGDDISNVQIDTTLFVIAFAIV